MKLNIKIVQDEDAQSPSEWADDSLFLVAGHNQFWVDPPNWEKHHGKWRGYDDMRDLIPEMESTHHVFMVEAYIHSGVVLAMANEGQFPDRRWDVSLCGAIFAAKKEWRLRKSALKSAESLLNEWNMYLSGDVWGFIIEDEDGNHLDSCWGFYGHDDCESEAKAAAATIEEKLVGQEACLI